MAALTKFHSFVEAVAEGTHNLGSNQLSVALTNAANPPSASGDAVLADIVEIAYTNLSSRDVTTISSSQTGGTYSLVLTDLILTASGGPSNPFRYVVLYNSTAAGGPLIGFADYLSDLTLNDTETLTIDFAATAITLT